MRRPRPRAFWSSLTPGQRRTLVLMGAVVVGLHVVGFALLISLATPAPLGAGAAIAAAAP